MDHVIRCLNLEVEADHVGNALAFQQRVVNFAQEELLLALERVAAAVPAEREVWIERLDVELGVDDIERPGWERELAARFERAVTARLVVEERSGTGLGATANVRVSGWDGVPSESTLFDAVHHYLACGRLPWFWTSARGETLADETASLFERSTASQLARYLLPTLRGVDARLRFLRLVGADGTAVVLERWGVASRAQCQDWSLDVARLTEALQSASNPSSRDELASRRWQGSGHAAETLNAFWTTMLGSVASVSLVAADGASSLGSQLVAPEVARRQRALAVEAFVRAQLEAARAPRSAAQAIERGGMQGALGRVLSAFRTDEFRRAAERIAGDVPGRASVQEAGGTLRASSAARGAEAAQPPRSRVESLAVEGTFVGHAGVVLLGPYLRAYLQRLELADGERIGDAGGALAALHCLVTGGTGAPSEHELVLEKVLCGLPLDEVPAALPAPESRYVVEAQALLESVIEYWSALKKTSVGGLREAFLQRPGKLWLTERDTWLLQVEQRAYDMLLGQLPWSYRMLKLPWMERVLVTEWVD